MLFYLEEIKFLMRGLSPGQPEQGSGKLPRILGKTPNAEHYEKRGQAIRIISWNISAYKPGTYDMCKSFSPDIICL